MNVSVQQIHDYFLSRKDSFINDVVADYCAGKGGLHIGACVVLFHAIKTGDCRPITKFHSMLDPMESGKFKPWVGALTVYKDGPETYRLMRFEKDKGFVIGKGTHNIRGMLWPNGLSDMIESDKVPNFLNFKREKEKVDPNLEKLLKMVKATVKNVEIKADEVGATLPKDIRNRMDELLKLVEVHLPQAKGVKNMVKVPAELTPPAEDEGKGE